jgi:hypothetical protein
MRPSLPLAYTFLDVDGALRRIHGAGEFCQDTIARGLSGPTVPIRDLRTDFSDKLAFNAVSVPSSFAPILPL